MRLEWLTVTSSAAFESESNTECFSPVYRLPDLILSPAVWEFVSWGINWVSMRLDLEYEAVPGLAVSHYLMRSLV